MELPTGNSIHFDIEVKGVHIVTVGQNEFSQATAGSLRVTARLMPAETNFTAPAGKGFIKFRGVDCQTFRYFEYLKYEAAIFVWDVLCESRQHTFHGSRV